MNWEEEIENMTNMTQEEIENRIDELVKLEERNILDPEAQEKFKESLQNIAENSEDVDN